MIKYFFTVLLLSNIYFLNAQDTAYLDVGNVRALINSDGTFFQDNINLQPSFEVPKGLGLHSIFSSSFWMMDKEEMNNKIIYSGAYNYYGMDNFFNVGAVDIVNQLADSSSTFQRLWKISKAEIENHIQNWKNINYTAPVSIIDWPGNGNNNTAQNLAPFADLDNDGTYEPHDGEYPLIKGDQAVYLILNDYRSPAVVIDSSTVIPLPDTMVFQSAKLEVHVMLYSFNNQNLSISNSVFANVKIINRSSSAVDDHNNFKFSVFTDFDLGNPQDDYVGTDTNRNLYFAYNGDLVDQNNSSFNGYGSQLLAQGVMFLDKVLYSSMYFVNSPGQSGNPFSIYDFSNYQNAFWKNGTGLHYKGDGFGHPCGDKMHKIKFVYTGNPVLYADTSQWTESNPCLDLSSPPLPSGDRRMVGTIDFSNQFYHGDTLELNYAYISARDIDSSTHISDPLSDLFLAADTVQNFYDSLVVTSISEHVQNGKGPSFNLYPNPSKHLVNLEIEANDFEISIYDFNGRLVKELKNEKHFSIEELNNGIYLIKVVTEEIVMSRKLVVQH